MYGIVLNPKGLELPGGTRIINFGGGGGKGFQWSPSKIRESTKLSQGETDNL